MNEDADENMKHKCGGHQLNLWYCENCRMVHLRAGRTVLSFSSREFAEFTEAVVDIHYSSGWQMSQYALPIFDDGILESDVIV